MLFIASCLAGLVLPFLFFSEKHYLPNFFSLFIDSTASTKQKELPRSCSICDEDQCSRKHASNSNTSAHSHINFKVPQALDEVLEETFNLLLDHHIYSWYKEISVHDQLADEIRYVIRYAAASLGSRLSKVDLGTFIFEHLIPSGLSHMDAYIECRRKIDCEVSVEEACLRYLHSRNGLHRALLSREEESNYLRAVVTALYPYLIPIKYQNSRIGQVFLKELFGPFLIREGLDLLADPNTVNFLFILLLKHSSAEKKSTAFRSSIETTDVLLLSNFSSINTHPRNSALRCNLSAVLKEQGLLYHFHTFLKEESAINILQFCLTVEDFNRHILDPELDHDQLTLLHKDALDLYHSFIATSALDRLNFSDDIVLQIKEIVHSDVDDIVKLRTTRPLFQAYEYAYNLLEKEYLPLFINSSAYFGNICGSGTNQSSQKSALRECTSLPLSLGQKVGNSLRSLGKQISLRTDVIEGSIASDYQMNLLLDDAHGYREHDISPVKSRKSIIGLGQKFCDLSAWRVSIPRVERKQCSSGKYSFVFIVDVTRIDISGDDPEELHWEVERQYHEFYILEAKLTEFHGEFVDNCLPPQRSLFASKGIQFMKSRQEIFEGFLQRLLQKPVLRNSQLLFLFLMSKDDFRPTYLPDVTLGRFLRDVPKKLIKERGQYMDSFITSFISTSNRFSNKKMFAQVELSRVDSATSIYSSMQVSYPRTKITIFGDNAFNFIYNQQNLDISQSVSSTLKLSGIFDVAIYIAVRVYGLSLFFVRWCTCLKVFLGNTVDIGVKWWLKRRLKREITVERIIQLVHVTRDALFSDQLINSSPEDIKSKVPMFFDEIVNLVPVCVQRFLPLDGYKDGAKTLIDLFQHPVYNKQLTYVLLDKVLRELFPEIENFESTLLYSTRK